MAAIPDKYSGRVRGTVQTATGGTTIRPIVNIPEKYTRTFSGQPVSLPPSVVISGVRKPEEGPVRGRTITIVGSGIVPPSPGGGGGSRITRAPVGRTVVGTATPISPEKPSAVVISGVRKPEEGPVRGKTLEEQGMRVVGGKVLSTSDLQFGSWSDPMKEIARRQADQGDVLSKFYLAVDDPTIPGSPAWMEAREKERLKQIGFAEGKYGSPGGPTTGNVVGDVVLQGLKGLRSGITGIVPGTVRTITSGVWGLSLMKKLTPEEVLETGKGGAQTMVSEVVKGAAEDPAFFVGSLIPSVVLAKGFKTTKVPTAKKTPSVKIITEGKGGTKTPSAPTGTVKVGTTRVVSSVDVPKTAGQITRNAETYMAKLPSKEQWVIVNRMMSGENITLPIAKKIVREYRVFGERARRVDVIPPKTDAISLLKGPEDSVFIKTGTGYALKKMPTKDVVEYSKTLTPDRRRALMAAWEFHDGDFTLARAKGVIKDYDDMVKWNKMGVVGRLDPGQFKKVTPDNVLINPDSVLIKTGTGYALKKMPTKDVVEYSKTLTPDRRRALMAAWEFHDGDFTLARAKGVIKDYDDMVKWNKMGVVGRLDPGQFKKVTPDNVLTNPDSVLIKTGTGYTLKKIPTKDVVEYSKTLTPDRRRALMAAWEFHDGDFTLARAKGVIKDYDDMVKWNKMGVVGRLDPGQFKKVTPDNVLINPDSVLIKTGTGYALKKMPTKDVVEYSKTLTPDRRRALMAAWEFHDGDFTLARAKGVIKDYDDMVKWNKMGVVGRLDPGQFKKVTPGSVLTNPDSVLIKTGTGYTLKKIPTKDVVEYSKTLTPDRRRALMAAWEFHDGDFTLARAKGVIKDYDDMVKWNKMGVVGRLDPGQFKKVTPDNVLINPDDVLRSVSKISITYKTKKIVFKTVPKVSKTKKPVEVRRSGETSVSVRRPADVVKASKARRAEKAVPLSKQRPAARGGEGERILKEGGRGGELSRRADVPKVQADEVFDGTFKNIAGVSGKLNKQVVDVDVKVPRPSEGMVMMQKMRMIEVLKTADDVKTIPKQKMATVTKLRPADRVKASKAKTKTSSKDVVKTRASKRTVVPIRAGDKRRVSLTPLAAVGPIVTIKSGQGVVSQIVPDTTMPPVSIPRVSVQEMTAELSTEAVVPDTRVLTGVVEDTAQIQKPVSVVKTVKPAKLVEKPKIPVVPRVPKKPKRPVKTDASKDKKEEEEKKKVKKVVRTYVQRDYLLPWMIDESDDSWLQTDLRRMRAV